jgi:hypothetical protein
MIRLPGGMPTIVALVFTRIKPQLFVCSGNKNWHVSQFCVFVMLRSPKSQSFMLCSLYFGKLSMMMMMSSRGAPAWFEIVWNYGVEAIDY